MAYKCREEIVGKRFLSVSSDRFTKIKGKVRDWSWRAGVIRAATHRDITNSDLQVLVEYDDVEWQRREWITVYHNLFHIFLVEQALVWADRKDPYSHGTVIWPALTFMPIVSNVEIPNNLQPVEFLLDRELTFKEYKTLKPYHEWDSTLRGVRDYPELRLAVKRWAELQDGQRILLTTPSVLVGYRVEVYRAEGTTQWYTAVIIGYNEATRDLTVTDDTVLEEHNEDPALVQMRLIGDGVVESIMRGENVGITPRRSRSSALLHQQNTQLLQSRVIRGLSGVNCQSNVTRRPRQGRSAISETGNSPEPPDKGTPPPKTRKRKTSESDNPSSRTRYANSIKEDLENKQSRKKNVNRSINKKKVLEEANNSKLREVEVVVEDCLQSGTFLPTHSQLLDEEQAVKSEDSEEKQSVKEENDNSKVVEDEEAPIDEVVEVEDKALEENVVEVKEEENISSVSNSDESGSSCSNLNSSVQDEAVVEVVEEANCDNLTEPEQVQNSSSSISEGVEEVREDDDGDARAGAAAKSSMCDQAVTEESKTTDEAGGSIGDDDCVIVASHEVEAVGQSQQRAANVCSSTPSKGADPDCSIRGDDDGPLCSSSPLSSRMDFNETPNSLRFADDRSDSGVSSLRSGSGDERSGSRSSALSSSDEPNSSTGHPATSAPSLPAATRSPLFVPAGAPPAEPVRIWRDPGLLHQEEPQVRHVHSVQHQSLLMSHPQTPSAGPQPPTSAPTSHPAALYPTVSHMAPHPLAQHPALSSVGGHPHLPPHPIYHPPFPDMIWSQRYAKVPTHLLGNQQGPHVTEEQLLEQNRVLLQDRHHTERMIRQQEIEKQQKEKERLDRERHERDKLEREREREKQEREREEKERQDQALQNHFEKSLKAAQQKREQWNLMGGRQTQSREDERKQEMHQREQQRHLSAGMAAARGADPNHRSYYAAVPSKSNVPSKGEYPPPPAHSRLISGKPSDKMTATGIHPSMLPKGDLSMYGYQVHASPNAYYEPKKSSDLYKTTTPGGLVVTKAGMDGRELPNPPPLVSEMKNSVIVKHDAKTSHHVEPRVSIALSPSPKLRSELMGHYMTATGAGGQKSNIYEYRSPTQSPHHMGHAPSPHHHLETPKSGQHHRSSGNQMPSPHHQRQSPHGVAHPHSQQHMSPELRFRQEPGQTMIFPTSGKAIFNDTSGCMLTNDIFIKGKPGFPFMSTASTPGGYTLATTASMAGSKPKVSSPAPQHIYGKPSAVSVVPVSRPHEVQAPPHPVPKPPLSANVSPSPYQQVSQYHPPAMASSSNVNSCPPPPAHSSRTTSTIGFDRMYPSGPMPPASLSVKLLHQPGTSPPTASSAPLSTSRPHPSYSISPGPGGIQQQVQTQPLDLGISSNKSSNDQPTSPKRKTTPLGTPVCLEVKKRRVETPPGLTPTLQQNLKNFGNNLAPQPQLARVSEPSPLIASAATTITTLVNTLAAYRTPVTTMTTNLLVPTQSPTSLTENLPDLSVTTVTLDAPRPASTDSTHSTPPAKPATPSLPLSSSPAPPARNTPTPNSVGAPPLSTTPNPGGGGCSTPNNTPGTSSTPPITDENPGTPLKIPPSAVDSEKSNSPGPQKTAGGTYPVRHLKKAWLQRHTGEDLEDTTGVVGSGSCVSLPLNLGSPSPPPAKKENPVNSIHSVGSMAVNSINKSKHFQAKTVGRKTKENVNGDASSKNNDDSSSSDQERGGRKSPPKRKPPKVKRKKGGGAGNNSAVLAKKTAEEKKRKNEKLPPQSESGSDSDKESDSAKDSDSGASTTVSGSGGGGGKKPNKEPRKRGRRPKGSKNDKGEEPRAKKSKEEPPRDPFRKPPVGQLKKTGETFLQDGPCFEVAPKLAKCRECRWTPNQRSKNMPNIFCRFYAFRRLRYTKNGQLAIAGFSDPHKDALEDDIKLWLPNPDNPPTDLDLDTSRFLLTQVGDHFCDLLVQEKEAHAEHMSDDKTIAWKRVVQGVREMCDVCETTLFNYHWTCNKCGFVVCLDCYKSRKHGSVKSMSEPGKDRDEFMWLLCTNRSSHEQEKLMLTQIIADDCLVKLGHMVHEMRDLWGIEQFCGCPSSKDLKTNNAETKEAVKMILAEKMNGVKKEVKEELKGTVNGVKEEKQSNLNWLADVALSKSEEGVKKEPKEEGSSSEEEGNFSTLRELLIRPSYKANGSSRAASPVAKGDKKKSSKSETSESDPLANMGLNDSPAVPEKEEPEEKMELKHYIRRYNWQNKGRQQVPIRIMTLTESKILYPTVPHSWLCDGKLLRLSDPTCADNYKIFQDQWKRGQPVIVSDVCRAINKDLWNPDAFARDFGDEKNDLVNCLTGNLVPNQPMRRFWEGFEDPAKRLKDERGQPMLLKLKDWPPGEDFAELLPARFKDLMHALPLPEYTRRRGRLNLASRLPKCFVRPDLGPKMYNAYGSALHAARGTTNLHLDVSDAVNVMVYVGVPRGGTGDEHVKEAFRAIDEAGCDILTRRRVRDKGELPGALWHIYAARDADKIRDLLNKVTVERGGRLEPHNDPIHDQSGYLDGPLRERLYKEYGVEGYAIVQCLGDAVFIPAGAPHQVRNLHNCIKVAEDFVSPENVAHCFHLTQEFRGLSDTHSNHEDKLQIKNIIYHAVKDALGSLGAAVNLKLGNAASQPDTDSS
ncbi:probable JmjC domain-containing histone demethylation protein 2C isoform X2 [Sitophilus oryzae]|uniref:[histone H3]-dimethyl-L-lysine(9) demethylase n=1 Tax=Sitophilus oryzae TaxID=7048 RepID=A0A6J2Y208_SITOR|nr:probable JmjC domain-containing histone demethylation protein 2C isoform X2 [Sitophilus oryzae]